MELINAANAKYKSTKQNNMIIIYGDNDFNKRANVITFNILSRG